MGNEKQLPQYQCHKIVGALAINAVWNIPDSKSISVSFTEDGFEPIKIDEDDARRFRFHDADGNPDLGFYVVYDDGYFSWSPTKKFEDGYTRIE